MAVILILVAAVALIFYAISLNFSRLSQTKTMVTIASDTGASQLASGMASWGQARGKSLDREEARRCGPTGVVLVIVAIIVIIIIIVSWGTASPYITYAYAGLVVAIGGLVFQMAVVQPEITGRWNRVKEKTLSTRDQFIDNAIQGALQKVVTDSVLVPDLYDMDGDGKWADAPTALLSGDPANWPQDRIGRFAFYYSKHLQEITTEPPPGIQDFEDALRDFLYTYKDTWGIYDPYPKSPGCVTAQCDPCCVPDTVTIYGTLSPPLTDPPTPGLRPENCPDSTNDAYWAGVCGAKSPYGVSYPWVYDPFYEDPNNLFFSFREQLGRDDEHQLFEKDSGSPNGAQIPNGLPSPPPVPPANFLLQDTTSYYTAPYYPATDGRPGIFPFFYKAADWALALTDRIPLANREHCYWSDYNPLNGSDPDCPAGPLSAELAALQLNLPINPAALTYNKNLYVDDVNDNQAGRPPLAPDKVVPPANVLASSGVCAQNALTDVTVDGFWKRGGDRFCSAALDTSLPAKPNYPYATQCAKNNPSLSAGDPCPDGDCLCGETSTGGDVANPINFPDDVLDNLIYGLGDFIEWAQGLLAQGPSALATDFVYWYPDAAAWIEPGTVASSAVRGTDCFDQTCQEEDGYLVRWLKEINMMINRLEKFRTVSYEGTCDQVWCVPPSWCPAVQPDEAATFDSNDIDNNGTPDGNGIPGDIEDVIACLDHNVNYMVGTATGNAERFNDCYVKCSQCVVNPAVCGDVNAACNLLPRSLVPGFMPADIYAAPDPGRVTTLSNCAATCSGCGTTCDGQGVLCWDGCKVTYDGCLLVCGPVDIPCINACDAAKTVCQNSCDVTKTACKNACQCAEFLCNSPTFDADVSAALNAAQGSCKNAIFMDGLAASYPEALNQVEKFRQRLSFLQNRQLELKYILDDVLIPARNQFQAFLNGPAKNLITARINYKAVNTGVPYQTIYAWRTRTTDAPPIARWHIVRVDARLPGKCDDACNTAQTATGDPGWPWIKSETRGWGTSRCYMLKETNGVVKFRTTRFDENRGSSVFFPNGVPLWEFTFFHPDRPPGDYADAANPYNLVNLEVDCGGSIVEDLPGGTPGSAWDIYDDAFILNERLDMVQDPGCLVSCENAGDSAAVIACKSSCLPITNTICWDRIQRILTRGVTSERCAQYYWHKGTNWGMGFKFVPCKEF